MEKQFDVIVIGGGPGGYTAAMYAARSGFKTLVIEKLGAGGQMNETVQIDNYPGFPQGIDGFTLGQNMQQGAERFGVQTKNAQVTQVDLTGEIKTVTAGNEQFSAKAVVIATGASHRKLGIAGEEGGKGVAYCAACDGMFYRGKTVAVVGGGNSAVADALVLSRLAEKVILIHRRDSLRATRIYHDQLLRTPNVQIRWNSRVKELIFADKLTGVLLENVLDGQQEQLSLDGLFISVGRSPATGLFAGQVELDPSGYVIAGEDTKTNLPGVYAVGDVRTKEVRQIVTAVADGAAAAAQIEQYLLGV